MKAAAKNPKKTAKQLKPHQWKKGQSGNPRGRATKYRPEYAEQARTLCTLYPAIDKHLAKFFKVDLTTIQLWKTKHPEFSGALKEGKGNPDDKVESALYTNAIEGDTPAQKFWLTNRRPEKWKERREFTGRLEVTDKSPDAFELATTEELRTIIDTGGQCLLTNGESNGDVIKQNGSSHNGEPVDVEVVKDDKGESETDPW